MMFECTIKVSRTHINRGMMATQRYAINKNQTCANRQQKCIVASWSSWMWLAKLVELVDGITIVCYVKSFTMHTQMCSHSCSVRARCRAAPCTNIHCSRLSMSRRLFAQALIFVDQQHEIFISFLSVRARIHIHVLAVLFCICQTTPAHTHATNKKK